MTKINGRTFEIRDRLSALGCEWSKEHEAWFAPDDVAGEAQSLADAETLRQWRGFAAELAWCKGAFTDTVWEAALRACSIGLAKRVALEEIADRIAAGGGSATPQWLERNVGRAYANARQPDDVAPQAWSPDPASSATKKKPKFEEDKLAKFAEPWLATVDTAFLADRSPLDPPAVATEDFLRALYVPGERVVIFDKYKSQGQWTWTHAEGFVASAIDYAAWDGNDPHHAAAPPLKAKPYPFTAKGPDGVWYLNQPVDGNFRATEEVDAKDRPTWSRRSAVCVTAWRYFVLESDVADPRLWMGAVVQLPLPIAAIYTSGGASIHVLLRLDAESKAEFDLWRQTAIRNLTILGGDPAAMTAVRLTRLPGCLRLNDKEGKPYNPPRSQKLLFLDPDPSATPICERSPLRDSFAPWARWAESLLEDPSYEMDAEDYAKLIAALKHFRTPAARDLLERLRNRHE